MQVSFTQKKTCNSSLEINLLKKGGKIFYFLKLFWNIGLYQNVTF